VVWVKTICNDEAFPLPFPIATTNDLQINDGEWHDALFHIVAATKITISRINQQS
jgi:hypothetical protein